MIILVALEQELKRTNLPNHHIEYTGLGKLNAAIKTLEVINKFSPKLIVNFGTAGSLRSGIQGLVEISSFSQRDMDVTPLGFRVGQTPYDEIEEIRFGENGYSCGTGDTFVTEPPKLKTDVVDMEAYAIAKICYLKKVNFRCFKYISDHADDGASNDWIENISKGKKLFIDQVKILYAEKNV